MKLRLDYGSHGLEADFPDTGTRVIEPRYVPPAPDPLGLLVQALREPIGRPPLRDMVGIGRRIGISVCDITRAQPRPLMLGALFREMPDVRPGDVTIFIATGTHRGNTPGEIGEMLGEEFSERCRIVCHDARDAGSLENVGETRTGVPVFLNAEWMRMDFRITTGFVEPHFFAGFSGGPKMVAPGLAGLETVLHLHDAARIGHSNSTWGVIRGNPVQDDVREIARMTGVDFALDVILNRDQRIVRAFGGELFAEHAAACDEARAIAMQAVPAPFDVVVTTNSGYPLDQNLYQAVKGMSAAARIVRPGGTIICAAECRDGIPDHGRYGEILAGGASPRELLETIMRGDRTRPDQWQVQIQAQIQQKARVMVRSDGLGDDQIRAAHLEPVADIGATVRGLLSQEGNRTLCILPRGPQTIPYVA